MGWRGVCSFAAAPLQRGDRDVMRSEAQHRTVTDKRPKTTGQAHEPTVSM